MTIQPTDSIGECRLSIDGELTISTVAKIKTTLASALEKPENLVVDLGNIEEFDTAGLQLMLAAVQCGGNKIRLINHSAAVLQTINLANLGTQLGVSIPVRIADAGG